MEVVCKYIHPSYAFQVTYFNESKDKMIEWLLNFRTFVYKRVPLNTSDKTEVHWQLIRRIFDFPSQLTPPNFVLNGDGYEGLSSSYETFKLEFMSPDFSRYLVPSNKSKEFIVKEVDSD